jgi:hypothetical protein
MHTIIKSAAVACVSAMTLTLTAGPASAAVLEREHIVYEDHVEVECDGLMFSEAVTGTLNLLVVERGRSGLPHFSGTFHETSVFTNPETGRTYTGTFNGVDRDRSVTDNGDGTLSIVIQGSGAWAWYDADGKLLFHDTGTSVYEIRVDHNGTPSDPGDDGPGVFVGDLKELTGRTDTYGRDFCRDLIDATG